MTIGEGEILLAEDILAIKAAADTALAVNVLDPKYGAKGDGVADDAPAFALAIATGLPVHAPITPTGYRLSSGIKLIGEQTLYGDPASRGGGVTGTRLIFDNAVPICVMLDGGGGNAAQGLRDLTVDRAGGAPPAGSVGILIQSAYNTTISDVMSLNHAKCWRWYADGVTGLSSMVTRCGSAKASDVHVEIDSWPELRFSQCRFGRNGLGDYDCNAYVRFTGGEANPAPHPGIGPNSIVFGNTQFNQGEHYAAHWVTFDDMLGGGYSAKIFVFSDCHVEGATAGLGSNAGTPLIDGFHMTETTHNVLGDLLDLDPATAVNDFSATNCYMPGGLSLSPTSPLSLRMLGCVFLGAVSITGNGGSTADLVSCKFAGGLTLAGSWTGLNVLGGQAPSLTCTAHGTVAVLMPPRWIITESGSISGDPRGVDARDWQSDRAAGSQVANAASSVVAGGSQNSVAPSGHHGTVGGGLGNSVHGPFSWTPGGANAFDHGAVGRGVWASGQFATLGDAQASEFVLRGATTLAKNGTILTTDGQDESASNVLVMPPFSVMMMRVIGGVRQGGNVDAGLSAAWDLVVVARRGTAGNIVLYGPAAAGAQVKPTFGDAAMTGGDVFLQFLPSDNQNGVMIQAWNPSGTHGNLFFVVRVMAVEVVA